MLRSGKVGAGFYTNSATTTINLLFVDSASILTTAALDLAPQDAVVSGTPVPGGTQMKAPTR